MKEALEKFIAMAKATPAEVSKLNLQAAGLAVLAQCEETKDVSDDVWLLVPSDIRSSLIAIMVATILAAGQS